uniref:Translation initiation factor 4E n=1 Tax=Mimivirus LCMiAC02 TaxID=2506609 RepID=A0A4D5XFC9_9VIRU|nr:MAG: translation initiation factor 4E [Mimivirus LCMiAC02]
MSHITNINSVLTGSNTSSDGKSQPSASGKSQPSASGKSQPSASGRNIELPHELMLWSHEIHSNNWYIDGYSKICDINNVSDFWKVFNNFEKMNTRSKHYYLMKSGIDPTWEHPSNSNGGQCSFRIEHSVAKELWENLCVRFVCNELYDDVDDINGLSYSPKNNWVIVKIWNKNGKNNIEAKLRTDLKKKLDDDNISIKYKINIPEH